MIKVKEASSPHSQYYGPKLVKIWNLQRGTIEATHQYILIDISDIVVPAVGELFTSKYKMNIFYCVMR